MDGLYPCVMCGFFWIFLVSYCRLKNVLATEVVKENSFFIHMFLSSYVHSNNDFKDNYLSQLH